MYDLSDPLLHFSFKLTPLAVLKQLHACAQVAFTQTRRKDLRKLGVSEVKQHTRLLRDAVWAVYLAVRDPGEVCHIVIPSRLDSLAHEAFKARCAHKMLAD